MYLKTPLDESFLLNKITAREAVSELFLVHAEIDSHRPDIESDSLIGQAVSVRIGTPGGGGRFINGVVSSFEQGDTTGAVTGYVIEISPWFWLLSQTQNCRIFPNGESPAMSVKDILHSIFSKYEGFHFDLQFDSGNPIGYCVQYLESDFAFASRIMKEAGDFRMPGGSLLPQYSVNNIAGGKGRFETFHYPGRFEMLQAGDQLMRQFATVVEQAARQVDIECEYSGFTPGHQFLLFNHPRKDTNGRYLILSTEHIITQPIAIDEMDDPIHYSNKTSCMQIQGNHIPYVLREKTPKPTITGVQVATVVSPMGKDLDLDDKGRILVKFPWDREDNTTSCRVRISQSQAASGWGGISVPHAGQEVLVSFLAGDPDCPIVVGRVYNASNMQALEPAKHSRTTISNHSAIVFEMEGGPVPDV